MKRVVLDTNVLIAALRSRRGRSNRLLSLIGKDRFEVVISVPLILEYEEVATRQIESLVYTLEEVQEIIDYICSVARLAEIFYLWRPVLLDPDDDLVLEAAVAGQCDIIVTFNQRDFRGIGRFGLVAQTPRQFLEELNHEPS